MKCPVCQMPEAEWEQGYLHRHLIESHGVDYEGIFDLDRHPAHRNCFYAPCGLGFPHQEECVQHVLEHGRDCLLEHFLVRREI